MPLAASPSSQTSFEVPTNEDTRSSEPPSSADAIVRREPPGAVQGTADACLIAVEKPATSTLFIRSLLAALRRRSIMPDFSLHRRSPEPPDSATAMVSCTSGVVVRGLHHSAPENQNKTHAQLLEATRNAPE